MKSTKKSFQDGIRSIAERYDFALTSSAKEFVESESPTRLFWDESGKEASLTLFDDHVFRADAFVYDSVLGTLALIWDCEREIKKKGAITPDWIARKVDDAVFLKDRLVVELPESDGEGMSGLQVEAIFAFDDSNDVRRELGGQLRLTLRQTEMLPAIGVHQWNYGDESGTACRKAFCWLLHETRQLLKTTKKPPATFKRFPIQSLTMKNFRLRGTRTWRFDPNARMVVFHGQNGSGKSSLMDAVELIQTGDIERVSGDLESTVRHHGTTGELALKFETVVKNGGFDWKKGGPAIPRKARQPSLASSSFCYNEKFEERLFSSEEKRAHLILEAFFPKEREQIVAVLDAREAVSTAFEKLPKRLQNETFLNGFEGEATPFSHFADVLPLQLQKPEDVETLGRLLLPEDDVFSIAEIDAKFHELSGRLPAIRKAVDGAIAAIESRSDWIAGQETSRPREVVLVCYEELVATKDLLSKALLIKRCEPELVPKNAKEIPQAVEMLEKIARAIPFRETQIAKMEKRVAARLEKVEQEFHKLSETKTSSKSAQKELIAAELSDIQAAGEIIGWPTMADDLQLAIIENRGVTIPPNMIEKWKTRQIDHTAKGIGDKGWANAPLEHLKKIQQLLKGARKVNFSLANHWRKLEEYRQARQAESEFGKVAVTRVNTLLGGDESRSRALNEMLDLMNPARWAYAPVKSELKGREHKMTVYGDRDVEQIFNTAELGLLALSMFLLLGPGVAANQLRTLWLDDPFHNMDEMTVQTVSRAIARVLRLWEDVGLDWYLVILLHSDIAARVLHEEAHSTLYRIPWLMPHDTVARDNSMTPESIPEAAGRQLQKLSDFRVS